MKQTECDVFISYSRKDYADEQKNVIPGNEVSKIKDALTAAGISYWFDEEGIYSGQNFVDKIVTSIEKSKIFLFLSSANSNQSQWTCKEIACADEFKKHIIPVRMDSAPYNKKVLFRIADLDYIEYHTNPTKGMEDMLNAIKTCLKEWEEEEERRRKEEEKKKELERRHQEELRLKQKQEELRRQEEQEHLIAEIELAYKTLNNEETKVEIERENLLLKVEMVTDDAHRETLVNQIKTGGPIHRKHQETYAELQKEVEQLRSENSEELKRQLKEKDAQIKVQIDTLKRNGNIWFEKYLYLEEKLRWARIFYWIIIGLLVIGGVIGVRYVKKNSSVQVKLSNTQETLKSLPTDIPFDIADIEIRNNKENWGDKIYSEKSTYLHPRIKYDGYKSGTYKLDVKFFKGDGKLIWNEEHSPKGYTLSDNVSIKEGEHISAEMIGWGGKERGNWAAGTYKIEIWYQGKFLYGKNFEVYSIIEEATEIVAAE